VENEAWDGIITKTVKIIYAMEHDDTKDEVVQTLCIGQCDIPSTPSTAKQITMQNTPVRIASVHSTPKAQQNSIISMSSSTSLDPTLASLLPRNTRSLHDIYNEDATNSFSFFSPFSQIDDPLTFEEVAKDDV
jgi:hypothetical protein